MLGSSSNTNSVKPDKTWNRLLWPTVCTVIATVVGGLALAYLRPDTNGQAPQKPLLSTYSSPDALVAFKFPSALGGINLIRDLTRTSCTIGSIDPNVPAVECIDKRLRGMSVAVHGLGEILSSQEWDKRMSAIAKGRMTEVIDRQIGKRDNGREFMSYVFRTKARFFHSKKRTWYTACLTEWEGYFCLQVMVTVNGVEWEAWEGELRDCLNQVNWSPERAEKVFTDRIKAHRYPW